MDNFKYKSEIDEYLNSIWNLQENLSKREEEMRLLQEKNKNLENELETIKNATGYKNSKKNRKSDNAQSQVKNSINNMDDLYKSTIISQKNKEIEKKIKQSMNLEKIQEEELAEKKRKEEELAEIQRLKEQEIMQKKLEEQLQNIRN